MILFHLQVVLYNSEHRLIVQSQNNYFSFDVDVFQCN